MDENFLDFDIDFMNDDEIENILIPSLQPFINKVMVEASKPSIVDTQRIKEFILSYKILKSITTGENTISYKLNQPDISMAYIEIIGKNIFFSDTDKFFKALSLVSNFEIYPRTDGVIRMVFTYHHITKNLEELNDGLY